MTNWGSFQYFSTASGMVVEVGRLSFRQCTNKIKLKCITIVWNDWIKENTFLIRFSATGTSNGKYSVVSYWTWVRKHDSIIVHSNYLPKVYFGPSGWGLPLFDRKGDSTWLFLENLPVRNEKNSGTILHHQLCNPCCSGSQSLRCYQLVFPLTNFSIYILFENFVTQEWTIWKASKSH